MAGAARPPQSGPGRARALGRPLAITAPRPARGLLGRLTAPRSLRLFALLLGLASAAGFLAITTGGPGLLTASGAVVGRDFLAFYGAGRILGSGEGRRLYDPALQEAVQQAVVRPAPLPGLAYFAHPPIVAVAHAPLSTLPYRAALLLHALLMAAAVVAGVRLLRPLVPSLAPHWALCALLGLVWFPMLNAVAGGQTTALVFLLLAWACAALATGAERGAGLALGLLLFKPQLALPLLGLLALRRRWVVVAVAALVGGAYYLAGAACCGWDWPGGMLRGIGFFRDRESAANGPFLVSILEGVGYTVSAGKGGFRALVPWVVELAAVGWLVRRWWRATPAGDDFAPRWAFAVSMALLVSPHTQHYDVALLLLPVLLLLDRTRRHRGQVSDTARALLALGFLAYPAYQLGPRLGFQPLLLLPLAVAAWAVALERRPGPAPA